MPQGACAIAARELARAVRAWPEHVPRNSHGPTLRGVRVCELKRKQTLKRQRSAFSCQICTLGGRVRHEEHTTLPFKLGFSIDVLSIDDRNRKSKNFFTRFRPGPAPRPATDRPHSKYCNGKVKETREG